MAKVVLITGASAGIGAACADHLHTAGWVVVGASRRGTSSGRWEGLVMDVDNDDSVRAGVAAVLERHGRIDAVVASAGWGVAGAVEDTSVDEAKAQMETNFWGRLASCSGSSPPSAPKAGATSSSSARSAAFSPSRSRPSTARASPRWRVWARRWPTRWLRSGSR